MNTDQQGEIIYRMGEEKDIFDIAHYLNMAGHGYLEALEQKNLIGGQSWKDYIAGEIVNPAANRFYGTTVIAECDGKVIGLVSGYVQKPIPPPEQLKTSFSYENNLLELRRHVVGSFYIANVAVDPKFRNRGIAKYFVNASMTVARNAGCKEIFGIIHEDNKEWLDSFFRRGFTERMRIDVGDYPTQPQGSKWVLVTKPVEA